MLSDGLVINASPLIFLASVDGLDWVVRQSASPVVVPRSVLREVAAGEGGAAIVSDVENNGGFAVAADVPLSVGVMAWDLGAGESQVLAHCLQLSGSMAVLDDKAARECAKSLALPVIGTIGMVLIAKRRGWIAAVQPVIARLQANGMFLANSLIEAALRDAGEW